MIISPCLPESKSLLGKISRGCCFAQHWYMLMVAIVCHQGRMSAQQAASAITGQSRHRATIGRFLQRRRRGLTALRQRCALQLLQLSSSRGRYVFIVDTTTVSHQGTCIDNTFSTGNRQRRPVRGRRYNTQCHARRSCHAFVWGLLLTSDGRRIPSVRSYYTPAYCQQHGRPHRTQADLAAELIRALPLPPGVDLVVLGDTAFESRQVRAACAERGCAWILPANPERVLSTPRPRPKLRSLLQQFTPRQFVPLRLSPDSRPLVALRRARPSRRKSIKPRTYYVHEERRAVHSIGSIRIVFSMKQRPVGPLDTCEGVKILLCNDSRLSLGEIVQLYLLRWQIELMFKELKSVLGMHQYAFRQFERVESWIEAYCLTLIYLEWLRARRMRSAKTTRERQWWARQRTHGLCLAVRNQLDEQQLRVLQRSTQTPTALKKLQKLLAQALAKEYRMPA